jgi:hypothetical protein
MPLINQRRPANLRNRKVATTTIQFEMEHEVLFAEAVFVLDASVMETF